jgi:hypothetical protein
VTGGGPADENYSFDLVAQKQGKKVHGNTLFLFNRFGCCRANNPIKLLKLRSFIGLFTFSVFLLHRSTEEQKKEHSNTQIY